MKAHRLIFLVVAIAQAGAAVAPGGTDPKFKYVLPPGFRGWACIDFGVADAPPLKRDERGFYLVEPVTDVILKTSSLPNLKPPVSPTELVQIVDGQERRVEQRDTAVRFESDTTKPVSRSCLLFDTPESSVPRPPTLQESRLGTSPILREFEFTGGSLCDLKQVPSVCISATDVRKRNIGRTIAAALGMPATMKNCDDEASVVVEYRALERVSPLSIGEIKRGQPGKGTILHMIWINRVEESPEASATRFGHDVAELFRKASLATCGR